MWSDIETIRNRIAGYDEPVILKKSGYDAAAAMRRLYARRRKMGLNAHGKPYSNRNKINKRYV